MSNFEVEYFPSQRPDAGAAIVVYGLDPIPGQLANTVNVLGGLGNAVHTYKFHSSVVRGGDPSALPQLVAEIKADVQDRTDGVDPGRIIMAGASLGTLVAHNIQQALGLPSPGFYATGGVNLAENVCNNRIFRLARRAFEANGISLDDLHTAWADIDTYPDRPTTVPGVCVISRTDPVVPYFKARRNLKAWQEAGAPVKILPNWATRVGGALLHSAAINFFDKHIREIIESSKTLARI